MVDYEGAIKKPFQDMQTLGIGIVIGALSPITAGLLGLLISAFGIGIARKTISNNNKLPKWDPDQAIQYLKDIIIAIVIGVVYLIPAGIIFGIATIAAAGPLTTAFVSVLEGNYGTAVTSTLAGIAAGGIIGVVGAIVGFIAIVVFPIGLLNYVKEDKIGAAFEFGKISKKVLTSTYLATFIVAIIYAIILAGISLFFIWIPIVNFVILGLAVFMGTVTNYTLLAQAFKETP